MKERKFSDIKLIDEYKGIPKGRIFELSNKLYKILGFDTEEKEVMVYAVRILKTTMKPSPKQPICEGFKFKDTMLQTVRIPKLKKKKF